MIGIVSAFLLLIKEATHLLKTLYICQIYLLNLDFEENTSKIIFATDSRLFDFDNF